LLQVKGRSTRNYRGDLETISQGSRAPSPLPSRAAPERLYAALERLQPSPVIALNRAVAIAEISGPQVALDVIEPLQDRLSGYFHYFGVKGGLLLKLGRHSDCSLDNSY
jgi:predicted RNA polymerase sigma factor